MQDKNRSEDNPFKSARQESCDYYADIITRGSTEDKPSLAWEAMVARRKTAIEEYDQANLKFKSDDESSVEEVYDILEKFNNCLKQESSIAGYKLRLLLEMGIKARVILKNGLNSKTSVDSVMVGTRIGWIDKMESGISLVDDFKSGLNEQVVNSLSTIFDHRDPYQACLSLLEQRNIRHWRKYYQQTKLGSDSSTDSEQLIENKDDASSLKNQICYFHYFFQGFKLCQSDINSKNRVIAASVKMVKQQRD